MQSPYVMTLDLNVLNHLGITLYSNTPAVLSEVVANAYDADAEEVRIYIDASQGTLTIKDDGHGMTLDDVNGRFLTVGYRRRDQNETISPKHHRPVMGRKGIGKLSLFSIARTIEIHTARESDKHALRMRLSDIQAIISKPDNKEPYRPEHLDDSLVDFAHGTRIVLSDLKKSMTNVGAGLRKRLARRFSVLGTETNFRLYIDDVEVTAADRDYFHKVEYLWAYEDEPRSTELATACKNATYVEKIGVSTKDGYQISGWIGTAMNSGDLRGSASEDSSNRITLMVRGKLAHEDLLEEVHETGIFRSYLLGEITADFLDVDNLDDIATSSRQRIVEDDPRYMLLLDWLRGVLKRIGSAWESQRATAGTRVALENPVIKEWFGTLKGETKKRAQRLFSKINQLTIEDTSQRTELFKHAVLAFETLRYRDNLDALDKVSVDNLEAVTSVFTDIEDLEAALYYQIVAQRLAVIEKFQEHLDDNSLEKVLQDHLFENLWLLDPSWERATEKKEERLDKAFAEISEQISEEDRDSRFDIQYKKIAGAYVIIELKRRSVRTTTEKLVGQFRKYQLAVEKYVESIGSKEPVHVVCVVGTDLTDWESSKAKERSLDTFRANSARLIKYDELVYSARNAYHQYLEEKAKVGRVRKLLEELSEED
jgi:hypothetical protein